MVFSTPIRGITGLNSSVSPDSILPISPISAQKSDLTPPKAKMTSPKTAPSSSCGHHHPAGTSCESKVKTYGCKNCDYNAPSLTALKAHLREHDLPCVCPICGKGFTRQWLLEGHIRTHNGQKVIFIFIRARCHF